MLPIAVRLSVTKVKLGPSHDLNKPHRSSSFRMYFDRGDLPIKMEYLCGGDKIGWTVSEFMHIIRLCTFVRIQSQYYIYHPI